jgi:hypothetical protein
MGLGLELEARAARRRSCCEGVSCELGLDMSVHTVIGDKDVALQRLGCSENSNAVDNLDQLMS